MSLQVVQGKLGTPTSTGRLQHFVHRPHHTRTRHECNNDNPGPVKTQATNQQLGCRFPNARVYCNILLMTIRMKMTPSIRDKLNINKQ